MPSPEKPSIAQRLLGWTLGAVTVFVLGYELYAHVASAIAVREHALASYQERLDDARSLARFTVTETGGLHRELRGDGTRVSGKADSDRASVTLLGPEQRLDDIVTVRVRAKTTTPEAADVLVGLETADGARRVVLSTKANDPVAPFAIQGDVDPAHLRRIASRSAGIVTNDAGAFTWAEWHRFALRFEAYDRLLFGLADDEPVASAQTEWKMGTKVRLFVAVVARQRDAVVDVELQDASYEQAPRPATLPPFVERFQAPVLDTRRWSVFLGDAKTVEASMTLDKTRGLVIEAKSKGQKGFTPAVTLLTPPTPLGTFDLRAKVEIRRLQHATVVVGVLGTGYSGTRFIDVGRYGQDGVLEAIASGHFLGNGQQGFLRLPIDGQASDMALHYDASKGRLSTDRSSPLRSEPFDLLAGEAIQLRFAVNLDGVDAEADVVVHEIAYDR